MAKVDDSCKTNNCVREQKDCFQERRTSSYVGNESCTELNDNFEESNNHVGKSNINVNRHIDATSDASVTSYGKRVSYDERNDNSYNRSRSPWERGTGSYKTNNNLHVANDTSLKLSHAINDGSFERNYRSYERNDSGRNNHYYERNYSSYEGNDTSYKRNSYETSGTPNDRNDSFPERNGRSFERNDTLHKRNDKSYVKCSTSNDRNESFCERNGRSFEGNDTSYKRNDNSYETCSTPNDRNDSSYERNDSSYERNDSSYEENSDEIDVVNDHAEDSEGILRKIAYAINRNFLSFKI